MEKKEKVAGCWCQGGFDDSGFHREGKNLESKSMMEPVRRGKEPGHANKSHHQRERRPFTRDFLCSSLVLTSIEAIIRPPPPPPVTVAPLRLGAFALLCFHLSRTRCFQYSDLCSGTAFVASAQSQQDKRMKSKHERIKVELRRKISDVESMIASGALDLYETSSVLY